MKMNFKAQAALEFLTTYGWAFLVILLMIGTLAYFGILSPGKLLPSRCITGPEFQCLDYQVKDLGAATDELRLRLKNNAGEKVDVTSFSIEREDEVAYTCTTPPAFPISGWKPSEIKIPPWTGRTFTDLSADERGKVLLRIKYNSVTAGNTFTKEVKGEVYTNVLGS